MYSTVMEIITLARECGVHIVALKDACGYFIIETRPEVVGSPSYKDSYAFIKELGFELEYVDDPTPLMGTEIKTPQMFKKEGDIWLSWFRINSNEIGLGRKGVMSMNA